MKQLTVVNVTLEDREDGGLRVHSDDLAGLILSGANRDTVAAQIAPSIKALLEHKGFHGVAVKHAQLIADVLQSSGSRNIGVPVQHEQFVVELELDAAE